MKKNTANIDRMTLTRHFDNPSFALARNIFEGALCVIGIFILAYVFVENSEREYSQWIPSMQESFANLIWFLASTELLPLLGSQFETDTIADRVAAVSFVISLIFKIQTYKYWINMMFFLVGVCLKQKREGEMMDCLKITLKTVTILSIVVHDVFRWMLLNNGNIDRKSADLLPVVTVSTLIVRSVVMVIFLSNICMLSCNSTLK